MCSDTAHRARAGVCRWPSSIGKFVGSLSPRYVLNYRSDLLFTLAEPPMLCISNSVLKLVQANPLGTPRESDNYSFLFLPKSVFLAQVWVSAFQ